MSLYERFCQLDRSAKGFISEDEFLSIPEFSLNPLSKVRSTFFSCMTLLFRSGEVSSGFVSTLNSVSLFTHLPSHIY